MEFWYFLGDKLLDLRGQSDSCQTSTAQSSADERAGVKGTREAPRPGTSLQDAPSERWAGQLKAEVGVGGIWTLSITSMLSFLVHSGKKKKNKTLPWR